MKQHGANSEDDEGAALDERPPVRSFLACAIRVGSARAVVVDGGSWNREHGPGGEHGKKRNEEENGALAMEPANAPCNDCDGHVSRMIECRVSSQPIRQLVPRE
jgi:hypothetical protein